MSSRLKEVGLKLARRVKKVLIQKEVDRIVKDSESMVDLVGKMIAYSLPRLLGMVKDEEQKKS